MGLYDHVCCKYKLPEPLPDFVGREGPTKVMFQTKDFGCELLDYVIAEDGVLYELDLANQLIKVLHTGSVRFYGGNTCACGYGVSFTPDGSDSEWVEYEAAFTNGELIDLKLVKATAIRALHRDEMRSHGLAAAFSRDWERVVVQQTSHRAYGPTLMNGLHGFELLYVQATHQSAPYRHKFSMSFMISYEGVVLKLSNHHYSSRGLDKSKWVVGALNESMFPTLVAGVLSFELADPRAVTALVRTVRQALRQLGFRATAHG